MRTLQLKYKNLSTASAWKGANAVDILMAHIGSLQMSDQFSLTTEAIEGLPGRLVAVYKLWVDGEDLRAMFPRRTFYRCRSELLKRGIDISILQPTHWQNVVPLVKVLRPEAMEQVPDWAVNTLLYFEPAKRRA
jgi:II/X family phage/plasmid replication protein